MGDAACSCFSVGTDAWCSIYGLNRPFQIEGSHPWWPPSQIPKGQDTLIWVPSWQYIPPTLWQCLNMFALVFSLQSHATLAVALWWQCLSAFHACALFNSVSTSWLSLPCGGSASSSPLPSHRGILTSRSALSCDQGTSTLGLVAMAFSALLVGSMPAVPLARAGVVPTTGNTPLIYAC